MDQTLQPRGLRVILREFDEGAEVGEGDDLRGGSDAGFELLDAALLDQRALGDDDFLVVDVGDHDLDDLADLRLERRDGGVLGGRLGFDRG